MVKKRRKPKTLNIITHNVAVDTSKILVSLMSVVLNIDRWMDYFVFPHLSIKYTDGKSRLNPVYSRPNSIKQSV
jgi:hypothetical protein